MTNTVISGTAYNTMANPTNKSRMVNALPAGLFDMSMISPNPTTPTAVTANRGITATASRRLRRLNSERSPKFKKGTP